MGSLSHRKAGKNLFFGPVVFNWYLSSSRIFLFVFLSFYLIHSAVARPVFLTRIPNGRILAELKVTRSFCDGNEEECVCEPIGHTNCDSPGRNNLNDFGEDFRSAGFQWTVSLCEKDSDGDGQSNGEELGDPACQWRSSADDSLLREDSLSHPGDPLSMSADPQGVGAGGAEGGSEGGEEGEGGGGGSGAGDGGDSNNDNNNEDEEEGDSVTVLTFPVPSAFRVHPGLAVFAGFGCLYTGALWGRYLKRGVGRENHIWFSLHRVFQTVALALFIAVVVLGRVNRFTAFSAHGIVAYCLLGIMLLQVLVGILRPKLGAPHRQQWFLFHSFTAIVLLCLFPATAILGIEQYQLSFGESTVETSQVLFYVSLGTAVLAIALLELRNIQIKMKRTHVRAAGAQSSSITAERNPAKMEEEMTSVDRRPFDDAHDDDEHQYYTERRSFDFDDPIDKEAQNLTGETNTNPASVSGTAKQRKTGGTNVQSREMGDLNAFPSHSAAADEAKASAKDSVLTWLSIGAVVVLLGLSVANAIVFFATDSYDIQF